VAMLKTLRGVEEVESADLKIEKSDQNALWKYDRKVENSTKSNWKNSNGFDDLLYTSLRSTKQSYLYHDS
jgi:hypothetical protein